MVRKIAFIGTHGVGKTVLTFSIASRLRAMSVDADVVHENSRRSPFPINEGTTLDSQMWILASQWQAELEATRRCRLVVCDRAVLDNYAYLQRGCGDREELLPFLRSWIRTYDALFWVPIVDDHIVADTARATSHPFQREIHDRIAVLVREWGVEDRVIELGHDRDGHRPAVLEALRQRRLVPPEQRSLF